MLSLGGLLPLAFLSTCLLGTPMPKSASLDLVRTRHSHGLAGPLLVLSVSLPHLLASGLLSASAIGSLCHATADPMARLLDPRSVPVLHGSQGRLRMPIKDGTFGPLIIKA